MGSLNQKLLLPLLAIGSIVAGIAGLVAYHVLAAGIEEQEALRISVLLSASMVAFVLLSCAIVFTTVRRWVHHLLQGPRQTLHQALSAPHLQGELADLQTRPAGRDLDEIAHTVRGMLRVTKAAEVRFRTLIDSIPQVVYRSAPASRHGDDSREEPAERIDFISHQIEPLTGYDARSFVGDGAQTLRAQTLRALVHPDDREEYARARAQLCAEGPSYICEYRLLPRVGGPRWVREVGHARYSATGELLYIDGIIESTDERRQNRILQRAANTAAEQAVQAKADFMAFMGRQIDAPLHRVIDMVSLLEHSQLTAAQREQVATIRRSGEFMTAIFNDILDISNIEADRLALEHTDIRIRELADQLIESMNARAESKAIALQLRVSEDVPSVVTGDPIRLQQILANLVDNAIKFTDRGSTTLEIGVVEHSEDHALLQFDVSDSGIGIAEDRLHNIFNPFSGREATVKRPFGSTGLGLAICQQLVAKMGGSIEAHSELACGSTFTVKIAFPLSRAGKSTQVLARLNRRATTGSSTKRASTANSLGSRASARSHRRLTTKPGEHGPSHHRAPSQAPEVSTDVSMDAATDASIDVSVDTSGPESQRRPMANNAVLVAEDNPTNQIIIASLLRRLGFAVELAANGHEAVNAMGKRSYRFVLMDCRMPQMDGYEASRTIRQRFGDDIPIIALTANAQPEEVERCLQAGMNDCMFKPVRLGTLKKVLERHLSAQLHPN